MVSCQGVNKQWSCFFHWTGFHGQIIVAGCKAYSGMFWLGLWLFFDSSIAMAVSRVSRVKQEKEVGLKGVIVVSEGVPSTGCKS